MELQKQLEQEKDIIKSSSPEPGDQEVQEKASIVDVYMQYIYSYQTNTTMQEREMELKKKEDEIAALKLSEKVSNITCAYDFEVVNMCYILCVV